MIAGLAAAGAPAARAQYEPSGYTPLEGEPFFLLSDKTYGRGEAAQVRLEVAGSGDLSAITEYGGIDVVLYRVPRPLSFLKAQKNLHRVTVEARVAEEGLANALAHVWDRWHDASRQAWRRLFSSAAREAVTGAAPELRTRRGAGAPTVLTHAPAFRPLPGLDLVTRFRYPVADAAPIQPPREVSLAGSSSDFITPQAGNVMIPIGRLEPGLYLVEAYVGRYHAKTLVFVADTVAITKASAQQMVVWAAQRASGRAVADVEVAWTDGVGVLQSGRTDGRGLVTFTRESPERSYVMGQDADGGVFISENFYYDSEIYDTKVYAVTDRPLYRPGDEVFVKVFARDFQSARASTPAAGAVDLTAYDPNGAPVARQALQLAEDSGGHTSFRVPENATAGGYELRLAYRSNLYSAAFRVAEYQKPHFDITLVPDKRDFKVREPITGRLQLRYTDGRPVRDAEVAVTVRSQQMSMVDGELGYYGQFPVKLEAETFHTDAQGDAVFSFPAVEHPSRYVITVFATDGAAYRVKTTKELLVERGRSTYTLQAGRTFGARGEPVVFDIRAVGTASEKPASWEWIRLEDQTHHDGALVAPERLALTFAEAGSYTVRLRDAGGNVVAATTYWVSGGAVRAPAGSIEIVPSRDRLAPGETADLLITFPTPVEEALLTLERDGVEHATLMSAGASWVRLERLAPAQWRARVPMLSRFAPNITFSVACVKDGDYVFQNQGLQVAHPQVRIDFRFDKTVYVPGDTVTVDVTSTVGGRPTAAVLAVGVVDEMVYVLQPEIAPHVDDFFHHPRRNNVRTAASQSFITYDLAVARTKGAPEPHSVNERRVKVLERPRRDEVDTAFWDPALRTDGAGRARFTFVMPDALTRWRVTARAMTANGTFGQRTASLRSEKDLYLKWTSPDWLRQGDAPTATIAAFNQTAAPIAVDFRVTGPGLTRRDRVTLQPGANSLAQPLASLQGDAVLRLELVRQGIVADALETRVGRVPAAWRSARTSAVALTGAETPLRLPADARNVRVSLAASSAAQLRRVIGDLVEYPFGCIEQTASRMIPLALGIEELGAEDPRVADRLRYQLNVHRLRLAYMAGPKATFTWWGDWTSEDPLLTGYAYYADWHAVRAVGVSVPAEHWNRLLDVYRDAGHALPLSQRALLLSFMQDTGLPVKSLVDGLFDDLAAAPPPRSVAGTRGSRLDDSTLLADPNGALAHALAFALADRLAQRDQRSVPDALAPKVAAAYEALKASEAPFAEALLIGNGRLAATEAERVLGAVRAEMPTLERALTLAWIHDRLRKDDAASLPAAELAAPWQRTVTAAGATVWRWPDAQAVPSTLALASAGAVTAFVQFDSAAHEAPALPASIERRFYRVTKQESEGYALELVPEGAPLSIGALYLDELRLAPSGSAPLRYALLEVPLPPGATVEATTWGIQLPSAGGPLQGLERARHQATRFGYAVPVDPLAQPMSVRHLVRFAQRGTYAVPRARLHRMYQPTAKAFEGGTAMRTLEVR